LPLIQVRTLVLHTKDNLVYSIEEGRCLADHIAGARFVELAGADRSACAIRYRVEAVRLQIRAGLHAGEVQLSEEGPHGLALHIGDLLKPGLSADRSGARSHSCAAH
jgi:hypothetical protein